MSSGFLLNFNSEMVSRHQCISYLLLYIEWPQNFKNYLVQFRVSFCWSCLDSHVLLWPTVGQLGRLILRASWLLAGKRCVLDHVCHNLVGLSVQHSKSSWEKALIYKHVLSLCLSHVSLAKTKGTAKLLPKGVDIRKEIVGISHQPERVNLDI